MTPPPPRRPLPGRPHKCEMYALDFQSVPAVALATRPRPDMTPGQFNKILRPGLASRPRRPLLSWRAAPLTGPLLTCCWTVLPPGTARSRGPPFGPDTASYWLGSKYPPRPHYFHYSRRSTRLLIWLERLWNTRRTKLYRSKANS